MVQDLCMQEGCGISVDRADASGLEPPVTSVLPGDKDPSELVGSGASSGSAFPLARRCHSSSTVAARYNRVEVG